MKHINFSIGLLWFILSIYSCTGESTKRQPLLENIVNDFAQLECRAIALREQRFALANHIRFTEDTLLHSSGKSDTERLRSKLDILNDEKVRITQKSLALADSIKYTLDSIMSHHLTEKEDKDQFNQLLHATLKNMHCQDSM